MLNLKDSINQISFGNPRENERVQNILCKEGIDTLEKLCQMTKADLQAIGKIGDVTICRIASNLKNCGLHLGMTAFECNTYDRCRKRLHSSATPMTDAESVYSSHVRVSSARSSA